LYDLSDEEKGQLNEILDVLNIDQLFQIAVAVRELCRRGYGFLKIKVEKGRTRLDLSSVEMPIEKSDDG
jgi:hypothetical protein